MAVDVYRGACDASAAVSISSSGHFVIASDEDYVLRVYDRQNPGLPSASVDVSAFLEPLDPTKEPDIEGAAQAGDRIYWISSHGRDKDGDEQESRQRLFATSIGTDSNHQPSIQPTGRPYKRLLQDLMRAPDLLPLHLAEAASLPPEAPGGLNIEGLAPTPEGHLLLGFRNPVPEGKALIVRLHNPAEITEGAAPAAAILSVAGRLNLGGRGIRALEFVPALGTYFLIAGSFDDTRNFRLYLWSGRPMDDALAIPGTTFQDLNPEELVVTSEPDGSCEVYLFSDDGDQVSGGRKCKKIKDASQRSFRATAVNISVA